MNKKDTNAIKLALVLIIVLIGLLMAEDAGADVGKVAAPHCYGLKMVPVEREYTEAANTYNLCPQLFKAVLGLESNWNHKAFNAETLDFGIGQINYRTAEALNIDIKRLRADRAYSIEQAARVLHYHRKLYKARFGAIWVCSYNQGHTLNAELCQKYLEKLKRHNY